MPWWACGTGFGTDGTAVERQRAQDLDGDRWFTFTGRAGTHLVPAATMVPVRSRHGSFDVAVRDSGGPGPAAVLVHGGMADSVTNWHCCIDVLAGRGWRVLAVDLPGFGRSGLRGRWSMGAAADAVGQAVAALGVSQAVWCGYSLGGPVCLKATALARGGTGLCSVRGLVLSATAARIVPDRARRMGLWGVERVWGTVGEAAVTVLRMRAGDNEREARRADLAGWGLWLARVVNKRAAAQAGAALARFDGRDWVAALDVDAEVVITRRDQVVPVWSQLELAGLLGGAVSSVDGGHRYCLTEDYGAVVADRLERWRT